MSRRRAIPPITWTILCILILAAGVSPYAKTANIILIAFRLFCLVVISVLGGREWWKYHHRDDPRWSNVPPDAGSSFLRKLRRWMVDEPPPEQK
jgi:hypothetical protein